MNINDIRIGHGYDVHRFSTAYSADKPLTLAGVVLPDQLSLEAHSDGDLVLHAICDAILGAIAAADIGEHFPDTDAGYANADSAELLRTVLGLARSRGFRPGNLDITLIAQIPRLAPHRPTLLASLAGLLGLDRQRINLKATTTEGMGYIGRKEGMACHCVVLMVADS